MPPKAEKLGIYERIAAIAAAMPDVPKGDYNKGLGFRFRSIDDALSALKPLLAEHRVFYLPEVLERVDVSRETSGGRTVSVVYLRVQYTFCDAEGGRLTAVVWGEGADTGDKATSKAMTMSLKAALFQVFQVTGGDEDPDAQTVEARPRRQTRARQIEEKMGVGPKGGDARTETQQSVHDTQPSRSPEPNGEPAPYPVRLRVHQMLAERFQGDVAAIRSYLEGHFGPTYAGFATLTQDQLAELLLVLEFEATPIEGAAEEAPPPSLAPSTPAP